MPKYYCQKCGGAINSMFEMTVSPNLLCYDCYHEKHGDRNETKRALLRKQGNRCVVRGCPWKSKGKLGSGLHVHRIISGRDGGKYEPDNCVLVCQHHHRKLEGLTRKEIDSVECTHQEIERMDLFHTSDTLQDYSWNDVREMLTDMCEELGVPTKCDEYDLLKAVRKEVFGHG